ncbi:MAG: hypothetical protein FJ308_18920 [Planctomycetes bacterium]|nr:hypothetical protein [Planctomycetota bacterium]
MRPIPWYSNTPSFDPAQNSYPGKYYQDPQSGGKTIQPWIGNEQLLFNPGFDTDLKGWYCNNQAATMTRITTDWYTGSSCGEISNRTAITDSPVQDITRLMVPGGSYQGECYIKPRNATATYKLRISIYRLNNTVVDLIESPPVQPSTGTWTRINFPPFTFPTSPTLASPPSKIELSIISNGTVDYKFDAFRLARTDQLPSYVYIDCTVLSDTYNPFSVNNSEPASSGIYIVDCRSKPIRIRNCRIRSTLVFTNCSFVDIGGCIRWETVGGNYPAMIVDGSIIDGTTLDVASLNNLLRESDWSFNFNPSHTPSGGIADDDFSGDYPCSIGGAILSTNTITLGNAGAGLGSIRSLTGPILAKNLLTVTTTTKDVFFPSDMILNPPPGFYPAFTPMRLIPGSIDEATPPTQTVTVQ